MICLHCTNLINLHLRLYLTYGKLVILQSNLVWAILSNSYNLHKIILKWYTNDYMHYHGGQIEMTHTWVTRFLILQTGWATRNCVIILFTQLINYPSRLSTSAEKHDQQLKIWPGCLTCKYHWCISVHP